MKPRCIPILRGGVCARSLTIRMFALTAVLLLHQRTLAFAERLGGIFRRDGGEGL